jgi:RHS repeat-associated protein
LTNETISGSTNPVLNGSVSYTYDQVGNRLSRTSTLAAVPSQPNITVDNNDRLTSDNYDNNGSTIGADGRTYTYDFENRIIGVTGNNLSISIKYNGDGNRIEKTVNGVTTKYLVDTNNLTGYAQVVEETQNDVVVRQYTYGLDLISQNQLIGTDRFASFYGKDGHGSTRFLTDISGNLTDSMDYDAFGNLINQVGSTLNLYLYAGEQYDPDLGLYYNRARYLDTRRGRFWSQDSFEGNIIEPTSLHKYLYTNDNPINLVDPSGNLTTVEFAILTGLILVIATMSSCTSKPQDIFKMSGPYNVEQAPYAVRSLERENEDEGQIQNKLNEAVSFWKKQANIIISLKPLTDMKEEVFTSKGNRSASIYDQLDIEIRAGKGDKTLSARRIVTNGYGAFIAGPLSQAGATGNHNTFFLPIEEFGKPNIAGGFTFAPPDANSRSDTFELINKPSLVLMHEWGHTFNLDDDGFKFKSIMYNTEDGLAPILSTSNLITAQARAKVY